MRGLLPRIVHARVQAEGLNCRERTFKLDAVPVREVEGVVANFARDLVAGAFAIDIGHVDTEGEIGRSVAKRSAAGGWRRKAMRTCPRATWGPAIRNHRGRALRRKTAPL